MIAKDTPVVLKDDKILAQEETKAIKNKEPQETPIKVEKEAAKTNTIVPITSKGSDSNSKESTDKVEEPPIQKKSLDLEVCYKSIYSALLENPEGDSSKDKKIEISPFKKTEAQNLDQTSIQNNGKMNREFMIEQKIAPRREEKKFFRKDIKAFNLGSEERSILKLPKEELHSFSRSNNLEKIDDNRPTARTENLSLRQNPKIFSMTPRKPIEMTREVRGAKTLTSISKLR